MVTVYGALGVGPRQLRLVRRTSFRTTEKNDSGTAGMQFSVKVARALDINMGIAGERGSVAA